MTIGDSQSDSTIPMQTIGGVPLPPAQPGAMPPPRVGIPAQQAGDPTTTTPLLIDAAEQRRLQVASNLSMAVQAFTAGELQRGHNWIQETGKLLHREQLIDAVFDMRNSLTSPMPHDLLYCAVYETGFKMQRLLSSNQSPDQGIEFLKQDVALYRAILEAGGYVDPAVALTSHLTLVLANDDFDAEKIKLLNGELEKITAGNWLWHIQLLLTVAMRAAILRPAAAWMLDEYVDMAVAKLNLPCDPPVRRLMTAAAHLIGKVRSDETIDKEDVALLLQAFRDARITDGIPLIITPQGVQVAPLVEQAEHLLGDVLGWTRAPRPDKYWKSDHGPLPIEAEAAAAVAVAV